MNDFIPNGYIVLARKIRRSNLWLSLKATHRVVMIELLLQAAFQDCEVVRNGEIIKLERGQIATSYQHLVDDIGDKDITVKVVRNAIEKLVKHGFLAKDEAKARAKQGLLLTIVNYGVYQDTENYKGKAEGKETGRSRAKQGQSEGKARAINNNLNNSNNSKNDLNNYSTDFESFWSAYPRKIGKKEAYRTWNTVLKKGESPELIIKCANNYAKDCLSKGTEDRFIKHPKTFLNDERYKDYTMIVIGGAGSGKYGATHGGVTEESRKNASRGAENFVGTPGRDGTGKNLDELRKIASNFE